LTLTRYGWREILILSVVFGGITVAGVVWYPPAAIIGAVLWAGGLLFFRDPARRVPDDASLILAPADGKVTAVERLDHDPIHGGPVWRFSIFLSILDVHINRAPYGARVADVVHKPGRFVNAMSAASAELNESTTLVLEPDNGLAGPLLVRPIAGLIARRIVCRARPGDRLERGQRFGMIKFGSRTDMTLPVDDRLQIEAQVGDKVRAGLSVMARMVPQPSESPDARDSQA